MAAVQHHRPKFLVVHLGGNDLDSDEDNTQLVVLKLIAFLQTVKVRLTIHKVTVVKIKILHVRCNMCCLCYKALLVCKMCTGFINLH